LCWRVASVEFVSNITYQLKGSVQKPYKNSYMTAISTVTAHCLLLLNFDLPVSPSSCSFPPLFLLFWSVYLHVFRHVHICVNYYEAEKINMTIILHANVLITHSLTKLKAVRPFYMRHRTVAQQKPALLGYSIT